MGFTMKFHVFGADEATGADRTLIVEAESEKLAYFTAKGQGVLPYEVIPAGEVQSDNAKFPKSQKSRAQRQQEEEFYRRVAGGGVLLVVALVCTFV